MKSLMKQQLRELAGRIDFPMVIYIYESGRIVAASQKAEEILGDAVTNINAVWEHKSKQRLTQDVLRDGSMTFYQWFIHRKTEYAMIDLELSSIVLGEEHLVIMLFEQSYKQAFTNLQRYKIPRILWRNQKSVPVGMNSILVATIDPEKKEKQAALMYYFQKETKEMRQHMYSQIIKEQKALFDVIEEVRLDENSTCLSNLHQVPIMNKNGTCTGILILYTLMLERNDQSAFQDSILRQNYILMQTVNQGDKIAVSWKHGKNGEVDFISDNVSRWGYTTSDFYNGLLTFQDIVHTEDFPVFLSKNKLTIRGAEQELVTDYRIRTKEGEIVWVRDETRVETIAGNKNHRQGTIYEIQEKTEGSETYELEKLLRKTNLYLYYQPIVDANTKTCVGAEALLRWKNKDDRIMYPKDILSVSEYLGMMDLIGNFVFEDAFAVCREKNEHVEEDFLIHINLSAVQLMQQNIVQQIRKIAYKTGVKPECIVFEVKESLLLEDLDLMKTVLSAIQKMGFQILLDDFGTGASSLKNVLELPIRWIKIDESFMLTYGTERFKPGLLVAITQLAHSMGLKVTVSGIETKEQVDFLYLYDIDQYQGFYFGYPIPKNQFLAKGESI